MQLNIPTLLTIFRILLIPFFVLVFYSPIICAPYICTLIFLIASLTDCFDGYLARRWNQCTRFGAFLDPIADKAIVTIAMVLIAEYHHTWWVTLPVAMIIAREIIISALREWIAELGKYSNLPVSWLGKIKTLSQMTAIIWMLWCSNPLVQWIGISLLWIAAILTLWSMFHYLNISRFDLFK